MWWEGAGSGPCSVKPGSCFTKRYIDIVKVPAFISFAYSPMEHSWSLLLTKEEEEEEEKNPTIFILLQRSSKSCRMLKQCNRNIRDQRVTQGKKIFYIFHEIGENI